VGFVSRARRRAIVGEFPSPGALRGPNQHFVALAPAAPARATFLPYSQHFVALTGRAPAIATKCCLPRSIECRR
jgi:hypothetical protein